MDLMKEPLYVGNSTNVGKVVIALFYMALRFAKGRKSFIKSLISYTCLCLPENHNFPKTYSEFEKVIINKATKMFICISF
jgi:hypothetical protein